MDDKRKGHLVSQMGKKLKDPGAHMYHAADGVAGGGLVGKDKRHRMRRALRNMRLRASGMTDDLFGSKETGGRFENDYEQSPRGTMP